MNISDFDIDNASLVDAQIPLKSGKLYLPKTTFMIWHRNEATGKNYLARTDSKLYDVYKQPWILIRRYYRSRYNQEKSLALEFLVVNELYHIFPDPPNEDLGLPDVESVNHELETSFHEIICKQ